MALFTDAMSGLGNALLPVVAALLFEELTFGGLVRLLIAPWPGARKHVVRGADSALQRGRNEHKNGNEPTSQHRLAGTAGCGGGK